MATTYNNMSTYFCATFEFFTVYTKLVEIVVLASNDLTTVKKTTSSGGARDYYWFRNPVPSQLS